MSFEEMLLEWGFKFNPFAYLNAAEDPQILQYMIIPDKAHLTTSPCNTLIFAPTGGGKTALRMYTTHSFQDLSGRSFVITYLPQYPSQLDTDLFLEEHLNQLAKSLVEDVFLFLLFTPWRYQSWDSNDKRLMIHLFQNFLPLPYYLSQMDSLDVKDAITFISEQLDRPISKILHPSQEELIKLKDQIEKDSKAFPLNDVRPTEFEFSKSYSIFGEY